MEIWKPTIINENYEVSNYGNIRSYCNYHKGKLEKPKYLKPWITKGYLYITIDGKKYLLHRLIAQCFLKKQLKHTEVNHKDGNKKNNHIDNLEWVTRCENIKHSYKNGFHKSTDYHKKRASEANKGEKNHFAKLNLKKVKEINLYLQKGLTQKEIAKMYGVSRELISSIKRKKIWNES